MNRLLRNADRLAVILVAAVAVLGATPTRAQTPLFYSILAQQAGLVVCDPTSITSPLVGTLVYNLPAGSNNTIQRIVVNGGPPLDLLGSVFPNQGKFPATSISIGIVSTPLPYTVVVTVHPAVGGAPTGFGTTISVSCDDAGRGSMSIAAQFVPAPASVPALDPAAIALLAAILAVSSAWHLTRRRRRARASG